MESDRLYSRKSEYLNFYDNKESLSKTLSKLKIMKTILVNQKIGKVIRSAILLYLLTCTFPCFHCKLIADMVF